MEPRRLREIVGRCGQVKALVAGDFCLDRYLDIDPAIEEISLETNLPAHQVVDVRPQGGGAANVLANVAALAPAEVHALGVAGLDGEGHELAGVLDGLGAGMDHFIRTRRRKTFTYTKPLVMRPDGPEELSRLDIRDRGPMPEELVEQIVERLRAAVAGADVVVLMEQVPDSASGVLSPPVKRAVAELARQAGEKVFLADSRCDVLGFSGVDIKVNREELRRCCGAAGDDAKLAGQLARQLGRRVFVTLGAEGIVAAGPDAKAHRAAGIPVAGPVDIVGAGDCVLAHLAMALAAGASVGEAVELANLAASIVIRKIGTTGTATAAELAEALRESS